MPSYLGLNELTGPPFRLAGKVGEDRLHHLRGLLAVIIGLAQGGRAVARV
jgi:hypothetical protein